MTMHFDSRWDIQFLVRLSWLIGELHKITQNFIMHFGTFMKVYDIEIWMAFENAQK